MKKILLLLVASTMLFSCTKDIAVTDATADLSSTLTQYDDTNLGTYIGVFTTVGTMERGVLEINITPEKYPVATIKLVSGVEVNFKASQIINDGDTIQDLVFTSATSLNGQTAFKMNVDQDGTNVQISEVVYNGTESGMIAIHETSRAPVVPITGILACDDCAAHPLLITGDTGTFSLVYAGDGSGDDTIMSMVDVGAVLSTSGTQSGCTPGAGSMTSCSISGGGTIGTNVIAWMGTHTFDEVGDCSEAAGTWSLDSANHGLFTGSFTSDVTCAPAAPANDTCATAEAAVCGGSYTGSTVSATDDDGSYGPDVWYSLTGLTNGDEITVSLCGGLTDYDSRLVIYDACGGVELFNLDDSCGLQSEIIYITDGSDVMVSVQAFTSGTGNYGLDITCTTPAPETCMDGIMNQDETGIDCGGAICPPCMTEDFTPNCGDTDWVDDGGAAGDYSVGITETHAIDGGAGNVVTVGFTSFDIEATWDFMYFYDGATTADPQIMTSDLGVAVSADRNGGVGFTGTDLLADSVTSTGQFLTVEFISDASVPFPGWVGQVTCAVPLTEGEGTVRTVTFKKSTASQTPEEIANKKAIMRKQAILRKMGLKQ